MLTRWQIKQALRYWISISRMDSDPEIVPVELLFAIAIATLRGDGNANASHAELSRLANLDLASVAVALDELESQRLIQRENDGVIWPTLDYEDNTARYFLAEYVELEDYLEINAGRACRVPDLRKV